MKILVVDDMPLMRHVMINMLRKLGYRDVVEATDGSQALKLLQSTKFDLVLTDLNMPKISGKDLFMTIRSNKEWGYIPVIVVTCEDQKDIVTELIRANVDGFIVKPFNLATLKKQIDHLQKVQTQATDSAQQTQ
ncbi:response regulator [Pseudoalteromonas sp. YIC-656]|uniref:response regulator n=1 Tax=Pseudoalteromonas pernae TaxID=3118054 RepID=UPI003242DB71